MTKKELEAYYALYISFSNRIFGALKPGINLWQKAHNKPFAWPDSITLIAWLIKEAGKK